MSVCSICGKKVVNINMNIIKGASGQWVCKNCLQKAKISKMKFSFCRIPTTEILQKIYDNRQQSYTYPCGNIDSIPAEEVSTETTANQVASPVKAPSIAEIDGMDGLAFEQWCADLLKENEFYNVTVTKSSGDQGVDILAEKGGVKYAIQCKNYSSNLGNSCVQEVNAGKTLYHCHVGAVMTNSYFTSGAKKLAEATGVLLWDRDTIAKWNKSENTVRKPTPSYNAYASEDPMLFVAIETVIELGQASTSILQRKLKLGYERAARMIDDMEKLGAVGEYRGSTPREVLWSKEDLKKL